MAILIYPIHLFIFLFAWNCILTGMLIGLIITRKHDMLHAKKNNAKVNE